MPSEPTNPVPLLASYPREPRSSSAHGGRRIRGGPTADSTSPLVSIITIVRNGATTLPRTAESVLSQDYPAIEYIVVDGGSTDGTIDVIRGLQERIAVWLSEADAGISDAFNKGIALARGEIVGIINSDDWYEPGVISATVKAMAETSADIAFGKLQYWEGDHKTYLVTSDASLLEGGMTVGHPTVFVRRACYERLGLFRLDFRQAMDYEWLLRAKVAGARFAFVDRCIANMQSGGVGDRRWRESQREVARARALHVPGADTAVAYHGYVARSLVRGVTRRFLDALRLGVLRRLYHRTFSPVGISGPGTSPSRDGQDPPDNSSLLRARVAAAESVLPSMASARPATVLLIIVNFNAGSLLLRAVEAVKEQSFTDFKLLVVDNASTDDSISRLQQEHPDVEVIRSDVNLGFAAANNLAVRHAQGSRWIALLNPDAFPQPGWLKALVDAALMHPRYASFASRTLDAGNPATLDGAGDTYHASGRHWRVGHGCPANGRYGRAMEVFSACAAAALYSRAAWDEAGGFDERYFCYSEDVDLGFRLRLLGYGCLYVPDAVAHHVGSAIAGVHSDFAVYYGQRNLVATFIKNMPSFLFWLLLPYHLLLNVGSVISFTCRRQGRVVLRAKVDALKRIPGAWRQRREIQARRRVTAMKIWHHLSRGWPAPGCE